MNGSAMPDSLTKKVITICAVLAIGLLAWAGPAAADPGANQRFTIISSGSDVEAPGRVIASGVINGVGTDITLSESESGGKDQFVFPGQGDLFLTRTDDPGGSNSFDVRSCVGRFSGSGTFQITGGTGRFVGASGSGTYTFRGTVVARTAQGCAPEGTPPAFFVFVANATATLHLAGQAAA